MRTSRIHKIIRKRDLPRLKFWLILSKRLNVIKVSKEYKSITLTREVNRVGI